MEQTSSVKNKKLSSICGVILGAVNGLFGGGGGMVAVPALCGLLNYPKKQAHATAILIILPVCILSSVFYVAAGYAEPNVIIPAIFGNVAGGMAGAKLLGKIPQKWVEAIFIAVMLAAGVRLML